MLENMLAIGAKAVESNPALAERVLALLEKLAEAALAKAVAPKS